ncbi:MAG: hypothetical protein HY553_05335 [Elusimicrobia bacterium]|nr:hypothetical protein [Elusimicrobiota bacterium]
MSKLPCRLLSVTVSASLIWLSPGLGAIEAFAQVRNAPVATQSAPAPVVGVAGVSPVTGNAGASVDLSRAALRGGLTMPVSLLGVRTAGRAASAASVANGQGASARVVDGVGVRTLLNAGSKAESLAGADNAGVAQITRVSEGVRSTLGSAGRIENASATDAAGVGFRLQQIVTQERGGRWAGDVGVAAHGTMGEFGGPRHNVSLGRPAGWDSIHRAVQSGGPSTPAPPRVGAPEGGDGFGGGERPPFLARLVASGTAFAPAVYFGFPLLAAGAWIPGALLVASGLGLAILPWLKPTAPAPVLAAPGVAMMLLGAIAALTLPGWAAAVGILVSLAGWGFERFARGERKNPSASEQMSAIFGALSATAAAGFVLTGAAGWVAVGLTALGSLFAARLLAELPAWVFEGVGQVLRSAYRGGQGVHQVMGAIRRDTVHFDRLKRLTERHVKRFGWFSFIWLAAPWGVVLASEAIMAVLTGVATLWLSLVQSPIHFGWGAFEEVRGKEGFRSNMAVRFANWGRETFAWLQGSKTTFFNAIERPILKLANAKSRPVSLFGALALRLAQLAWLVYAVVGAIPVSLVTGARAFLAPAEAWDYAKHSTSTLKAPRDPMPDEKPDEKDDPIEDGKEPFFPRLIASAVAFLPLYFFGAPFLILGSATPAFVPFLAAGAATALMPLMPKATPKWLRAAPGALLGVAGLTAAVFGNPVVGLLAALAGWGLANFATKFNDGEDRPYHVTDPEYVGAFFGALGAVTALGAALVGMPGALGLGVQIGGLLFSLLTTMHVPRWFFSGLRNAASESLEIGERMHAVSEFWRKDTDFDRHLRRWWKGWGDRSPWHWWWLWPTYGVKLLTHVYDFVLSAVVTVPLAIVRIPGNFLWGASYRIDRNAKATRFIGGAMRSLIDSGEGSKARFDTWVKGLIPFINRAADSNRPTIGALAALTLARVVQLGWIAAWVLTSPLRYLKALADGWKAMKAGPPPADQSDPLRPDSH